MAQHFQVTVSDVLAFYVDDLGDYVWNPDAAQKFTCFCRLPDGVAFDGAVRDALCDKLYSPTWRQGNGDGSRYTVLSITPQSLEGDALAARPWAHSKSCFADGQGSFTTVAPEEFGAV